MTVKGRFVSVTAISEMSHQCGIVTGVPPNPNPTPPVNQTLWVAGQSCELLNFALDTDGATAPLLDIQGSLTGLTGPEGNLESVTWAVTLDGDGNILCIATNALTPDVDWTTYILTYAPGSTGNVAPIRTVTGNLTTFAVYNSLGAPNNLTMGICVDGTGQIYACDGNGGAFGTLTTSSIVKFPALANGNVAPSVFVAPTDTKQYTSLFFDKTRSLIWAVNRGGFSDSTPSIDAYNLSGTLIHSITGGDTSLTKPQQVWVDVAGKIYVADSGEEEGLVFAAGADGNVAPIQAFFSDTSLTITGIAVDANGHIYLSSADYRGGVPSSTIQVFANDANGDAVPLQTMSNDALNHIIADDTVTQPLQLFIG